ncbi:hypothetical protein PIB30_089715 [Stylosanthes scabra]|uniref:Uncharacterized protein n=1 Tax=Stylosanthes scabra TaxID=79078 RepID=A0ABU6ZSS7_9FABA|nr:hypothetical protein [Stylosanthes scabra]
MVPPLVRKSSGTCSSSSECSSSSYHHSKVSLPRQCGALSLPSCHLAPRCNHDFTSNFAPVEEIGEPILITDHIEGEIPKAFPEGVYIRNGSNPLFGGLKSTKSIFGNSDSAWVEGEGMLHALYFKRKSDENDGGSSYTVEYNNKYVETSSYKLEKQSSKPLFLPAVKGDSLAVLFSLMLNKLRFGENYKHYSNTNVFEHSRKFYSVAESHLPIEIDILTLNTLNQWDFNGTWNRPLCSHPKRVVETGELVIFGVEATKPFLEIGIVSADGKELVHKVDIKLDRCCLCHEIGITQRLIEYEKEKYARIGIMPIYGNADSIKWFEVAPHSTFHVINSFEEGHQVVVWGCRALDSIIPGPEGGLNNDPKWFSRCYEWRLNMETGEVHEKYLTDGPNQFMDFPVISESFIGIKNKYAYTQVVDPIATSDAGMPKYGRLAKLYFEEQLSSEGDDGEREEEKVIKVEYHEFESRNVFCTGLAFVPKQDGLHEDDGWIIAFLHNEDTNVSQVHIIDGKKVSDKAVAKITLPCRVPYGFHGAFLPISFQPPTPSSS